MDSEPESREMTFVREAEALSPLAMARLAQLPLVTAPPAAGSGRTEPSGIIRRFKVAMDS